MKNTWIDVKDRLPEERKDVLVTLNFDDEVVIAFHIDGYWKVAINDGLNVVGDGWIDNDTIDNSFHNHNGRMGVIGWMELPKRMDWVTE